jgi:acyl carrier protein
MPTDTAGIMEELRHLWARSIDTQGTIADHDTFTGVGGDSIAATLCVNGIEERFGLAIEAEWLLDEVTTLRELSDRLRELLGG